MRRLNAAACLASALLGLAVHAVSVGNDFVYDDLTYVERNPQVSGDAPLFAAPTPPDRPELGLWRPLTVATYRLQYLLDGLDPRTFHAFNVAAHAAVSGLVPIAAGSLGLPPGAAAAAGVLFAVHPVHSEAVAWVVGRAEILAAFFALLALLAWGEPAGRRPLLRSLAAALLAAAAAASKETALPWPVLLVSLDALRMDPRHRGLLWRRAAWPLLALLAVVAARIAVLGRFGPSVEGLPWLSELTLGDRLRLPLLVLGQAARFLLFPHPLTIHYRPHLFEGVVPLAAGVLAAAALLLLFLRAPRSWRPAARASTLAFLAALAPFLHLVPIGAVWADRFLYLPSFGFLALLSLAFTESRRLRRPGAAVLLAVAAAWGWLSFERDRVFRTDFMLWRDAERKDPSDALPAYQLGCLYEEAGILDQRSETQRGAVYWWQESLRRDPHHLFAAYAHLRLGEFYAGRLGDAPRAARHYRAALALDPTSIDARLDLAALHPSGVVTADEARRLVEEALALSGEDEERRRAALSLLSTLRGGS